MNHITNITVTGTGSQHLVKIECTCGWSTGWMLGNTPGMRAKAAAARHVTLAELDRQLEHAPAEPVDPTASNLIGWLVGKSPVKVCARCAGRLVKWKCSELEDATPVWDAPFTCELSEHTEASCR